MIFEILPKAFALFLVLEPFGVFGPVMTLLKPFGYQRQRQILTRESIISLAILFLFQAIGAPFMAALGISQSAVQVAGGVIFLNFAMDLLFPVKPTEKEVVSPKEPFIVPIAMPLLAGPSSLATIIVFTHTTPNWWIVSAAILLAWAVCALILQFTPYLFLRLGPTGIRVCEQLIGLLCVMIAANMILTGIATFFSH